MKHEDQLGRRAIRRAIRDCLDGGTHVVQDTLGKIKIERTETGVALSAEAARRVS